MRNYPCLDCLISIVRSLAPTFLLVCTPLLGLCACSTGSLGDAAIVPTFIDVTDEVGLSGKIVGSPIARCCFVDLNNDHRPDVVIDRHRVFLNRQVVPSSDHASRYGFHFDEVPNCGLPVPRNGDLAAFADLDNDGNIDAIVTRYIDRNNPKWVDDGRRAAWLPGRGDGTFGPEKPIPAATAGTTCSIAVGDINRDGWLDLWLGLWYTRYGATYEAYPNDLLVNLKPVNRHHPDTISFGRVRLPDDAQQFDEDHDLAGRPTYGTMIADLDNDGIPELLELNYGRGWNRLWKRDTSSAADSGNAMRFVDVAPTTGFDGDEDRTGAYPDWMYEKAKNDPRFADLADEKPFRSNGNTFDAGVGDVNSDGRFDVLLAEITHAWAGPSADRSRILFFDQRAHALNARLRALPPLAPDTPPWVLEMHPDISLDRPHPNPKNWNQGDLFGQFADFNLDGRLDVLLSSGDYPDGQYLRLFTQQADGSFTDVTPATGLHHEGSQQISLADVNGDGLLDILDGETFNRLDKEQIHGRIPELRLYLSQLPADDRGHTLIVDLKGDPSHGVNRDAIGAIVTCELDDGPTLSRQLVGIGGHQGKEIYFPIHFGLGRSRSAHVLKVIWPDKARTTQVFHDVTPGHYLLNQGGELQSLPVIRP